MKIEGVPQKKNLLIRRLVAITGKNAIYNGAPNFSYDIGDYRILRDGSVLVLEENADPDVLDMLFQENLLSNGTDPSEKIKKGQKILSEQIIQNVTEKIENTNYDEEQKIGDVIIIKDRVIEVKTVHNLLNMIYSKQSILNKIVSVPGAFWISENLIFDLDYERPKTFYGIMDIIDPSDRREALIRGVHFSQSSVVFDGFPKTNDFVLRKTYEKLATYMYVYSKKIKWISSKRQDVQNEKYYCRNWLNLLGFRGEENKTFRDILLKNLRGNSAYRTEEQFLAQKARRKVNSKKIEKKETDTCPSNSAIIAYNDM